MDHATHPVDALFAALPEVEPYPSGVVSVRARIPGTAFFPGGAGLWGARSGEPLPLMPMGDVMVLGHDFHSEEGFARSLAQGTEVPTSPSDAACRIPPTWQALLALLQAVELAAERCFFTNAYMVLRQGAGTTGRFPGSRDPGFVARCQRFFLRQLAAQRPRVILTLGTWVPSFLAPLAPTLSGWRTARSMAALDAAGPLVHDVAFVPEVAPCTVAALTHPSLRGPNVGRRRYATLAGDDAERALIRAALAHAGLAPGAA